MKRAGIPRYISDPSYVLKAPASPMHSCESSVVILVLMKPTVWSRFPCLSKAPMKYCTLLSASGVVCPDGSLLILADVIYPDGTWQVPFILEQYTGLELAFIFSGNSDYTFKSLTHSASTPIKLRRSIVYGR